LVIGDWWISSHTGTVVDRIVAGLIKNQTAASKLVADEAVSLSSKEASPYEFDLVFNLDHLKDPELVADLVVEAFRRKFPADR
jgi:GTP:adenosylcobinamide-phosphate guanylyltransferase